MVEAKVKEPDGKKNLVPPDGGWGWMVVLAYTISGMTCIPIIQNFGLIYKTRVQELGLSSTQLTTIMAMNSSLGQILGVFQGPLLKKLGFRKMAFFGVGAFSVGTFLTGLATSFPVFILTHGVITSIGFTYTLTSFAMAMNSYFKKRRSRASGLLMGFTGLGPVIMPQFVTFSLGQFDVKYTAFLLAALNAHGFIAASLLRPIKWYMKKEKGSEEEANIVVEQECLFAAESCLDLARRPSMASVELVLGTSSRERSSSNTLRPLLRRQSRINDSSLHVYIEDTPSLKAHLSDGRLFHSQDDVDRVMRSTLDLMERPLHNNLASMETISSRGSSQIFEQYHNKKVPIISVNDADSGVEDDEECGGDDELHPPVVPEASCMHRLGSFLIQQFDLDLLKDPIFVNITLGLSIAIIGEVMFSLLTPFILYEIGLNLQETATFMSITAIADIISRFVSPYIGECIKGDSRNMYIMALCFLLVSRLCLVFVWGEIGLFMVAGIIGFAKGVRTVFWMQVLPDYVPNDKLGSALSIQNLMNGVLIFFAGPLSGMIVEINNSYLNIIYVSNTLTAVTVLLWTTEYAIVRWRRKK